HGQRPHGPRPPHHDRAVRSYPARASPADTDRLTLAAMELTFLLCTDGSDAAVDALTAGLRVLGRADHIVIATVIEPSDASLVVGTGIAGGVMSAPEFAELENERVQIAQNALDRARSALDRPDAELTIVTGAPGPSLCDLARSIDASVIVMGTRGL